MLVQNGMHESSELHVYNCRIHACGSIVKLVLLGSTISLLHQSLASAEEHCLLDCMLCSRESICPGAMLWIVRSSCICQGNHDCSTHFSCLVVASAPLQPQNQALSSDFEWLDDATKEDCTSPDAIVDDLTSAQSASENATLDSLLEFDDDPAFPVRGHGRCEVSARPFSGTNTLSPGLADPSTAA